MEVSAETQERITDTVWREGGERKRKSGRKSEKQCEGGAADTEEGP